MPYVEQSIRRTRSVIPRSGTLARMATSTPQLSTARSLGADRAIRIAATGDLHVRASTPSNAIAAIAQLKGRADLLIVVGDLTENGRLLEAETAAEALSAAGMPVVAVLGNHDLRSLRRTA